MELYIHIPFCKRKCKYCSFVSFPADENQKEKYIDAVIREAEKRSAEFAEPIKTVYIGGGTPSLLSPAQLRRMIHHLRKLYSFSQVQEFTVEANPGTLTGPFLEAAAESGINRISVGMQAYQSSLLNFLGRIHTFDDVKKSLKEARNHGFRNINLDLIFGIPFQTVKDWKQTLEAAVSLEPEHISAYGLIPEEGTPLCNDLNHHLFDLPDQEEERKMYDMALVFLREHQYFQYEISNFSRRGYECIHNIGYWDQIPYVGLGVSAASMQIIGKTDKGTRCVRRTNPEKMDEYLKMIFDDNISSVMTEEVSEKESRFETMMLALRMNRGIVPSRFVQLHNHPVESFFGEKLKELQQKGFMEEKNGIWKLTRKGMDFQNTVLVEFMEDSPS